MAFNPNCRSSTVNGAAPFFWDKTNSFTTIEKYHRHEKYNDLHNFTISSSLWHTGTTAAL
ncbi:MAG: hypothetical protein EAY75_17455 [Bacteroidetes bacterium]|nr:MAG: hypothetical protein EAY75_17455 [Bacteroidota bacterium]